MFGIGAGEFFLIFIILLVVVGPERLPSLARQAGQTLVRVRNWVQQSPDAAMVLRARQEIEAELEQLRSSLAEVQSVRDQVVEAAKQVQQTVQEDVIDPTRQFTQALKDEVSGTSQQVQQALSGAAPAAEATAEAAVASSEAATVAAAAADTATDAADIAVEAAQQAVEAANVLKEAAGANAPAPLNPVPLSSSAGAAPFNGQTVARAHSRGELMESIAARATATNGDSAAAPTTEQLQRQIEILVANLDALQHELRQRGLIGDGLPSKPHADEHPEPVGVAEGGSYVNE